VPSFTTFSRRHRAPRPHYCSCALAPARPSAECDAPDRPLLSAHSCACAVVPPRHAQRGRTNTFRAHAHVTSRCTANAPSRPLSRTSRVVLQAQPLMAATKEVRPLAMRVGVSGGARECTREYQLRANHPPRGRPFGVFFVSENNFGTHGMTENRMCAARGDQAGRCRGGAGRGRHGEEPRRLDCRRSAARQGAVPPMRPLVRSRLPLDPPEWYVGGSTRVPLEHHEYARTSTTATAWWIAHSLPRCCSRYPWNAGTPPYPRVPRVRWSTSEYGGAPLSVLMPHLHRSCMLA
jgi:hypothetical protein